MNEFVVLALLITLYAGYFFRLSSLVCFTLDYTRCGTRAWTVETAVVSWPLRELLNCRHPAAAQVWCSRLARRATQHAEGLHSDERYDPDK